jgi:hypothetical protein
MQNITISKTSHTGTTRSRPYVTTANGTKATECNSHQNMRLLYQGYQMHQVVSDLMYVGIK